ncbi:hypothetical protein CERSUDRAFT_112699 [Gelatoporia subvermispora B]|uniref:NTF2 domain-containing protein n=1 Tax=Ceriporiopsis subvermispora (strain B) TaxID=914234 RepID=M2QPM0_CERS8|nr:hypothetical protein CERSUDRAFT_112699 [Gelatoporia subvermispora B]
MSFRTLPGGNPSSRRSTLDRLSDASSASSRPTAAVAAPAHSEDLQPNEGVRKRRAGMPPSVSPAAPPQQPQGKGVRGQGAAGRGREGWDNMSGPRFTAIRAPAIPQGNGNVDVEMSRDEKHSVMNLADAINSGAGGPAKSPARPRKRRRIVRPNRPTESSAELSHNSGAHSSSRDGKSTHIGGHESKNGRPGLLAPAAVGAGKVKQERSPSPALLPAARPATEGSARFAPLPRECKSSVSGYQGHRQRWIKGETLKLHAKGLKVERIFVRDDGMVIDWTSPTPVMSDTLLPAPPPVPGSVPEESPVPSSAHGASEPSDSVPDSTASGGLSRDMRTVSIDGATDVPAPVSPPTNKRDKGKGTEVPSRVLEPPPPAVVSQPGSTLSNSVDSVERLLSPDAMDIDQNTPQVPLPRSLNPPRTSPQTAGSSIVATEKAAERNTQAVRDHATLDARTTAAATSESPAPIASSARAGSALPQKMEPVAEVLVDDFVDKDEIEDAALAFLRKYITTFDKDRATLAPAYSHEAIFSIQSVDHNAPSRLRQLSPNRLRHGRMDILAEILSLPERHAFTGPEPTNVSYDVSFLGHGLGVLLLVFSAPRIEGTVQYMHDERFVLRPREWNDEDRATEGLWPMVAVCHQITLRKLPP